MNLGLGQTSWQRLRQGLAVGLVGLGLATLAGRCPAITIDFAALEHASVQFVGTGDTFSFLAAPDGNHFVITASDGVGDAVGLRGQMLGTWTIGPIVSIGGLEQASVSGTGTLIIHDGLGYDLTGTLTWDTIYTFGASGGLNVTGRLNVQNISYQGSVADLQAVMLHGRGWASDVVSFQFRPSKSLTQLTTDGAINETSFSGTLRAPDTGSSLLLLGMGLAGLAGLRRRPAA